MFYECYIRVIEHSSVNVRLMLNNILRQKLGNSSECSQNVLSQKNILRIDKEHIWQCSMNIPRAYESDELLQLLLIYKEHI